MTAGSAGPKRPILVPVLVGLVAVLLVAVGGLGVAVLGGDSDPDPAAGGTGSTTAPSPSEAAATSPSPEESSAPADEVDEPEPESAGPRYLCWDGSSAKRLAACGYPLDAVYTGTPLAGINWVFLDRGPRLEAEGARCFNYSNSPNRLLHRTCRFTYGGHHVCMNWSQWTSVDAARDDYNHLGTPRSVARGGGVQLTWGPSPSYSGCGGLAYKSATMMDGKLWGVTAYADSSSAALRALGRFAEFRPIGQWQGVEQ